jgi:hypothetical protein
MSGKKINYIFQMLFRPAWYETTPVDLSARNTALAASRKYSPPILRGEAPVPPKIFFRKEWNKFRSSPPLYFVETENLWFPFIPHNAGR